MALVSAEDILSSQGVSVAPPKRNLSETEGKHQLPFAAPTCEPYRVRQQDEEEEEEEEDKEEEEDDTDEDEDAMKGSKCIELSN